MDTCAKHLSSIFKLYKLLILWQLLGTMDTHTSFWEERSRGEARIGPETRFRSFVQIILRPLVYMVCMWGVGSQAGYIPDLATLFPMVMGVEGWLQDVQNGTFFTTKPRITASLVHI